MKQAQAQNIYIGKVRECLSRLKACESFLDMYSASKNVFVAEAAILQIRKALECVAYAAVAPNRKEYAEFRAKADGQPDYTKDFHAGKILNMLTKINSDFYPKPVSTPISTGPGKWHFDRREDASLTKKQFETFYDRLSKFLHADNPWGNDKGLSNLLGDIPDVIHSIRLLLSYHFTVIRTPELKGLWVIETPLNGEEPRVVVGRADGDFVVDEKDS